MQASAACQVSLRHFGVWRSVVAALTLIAVIAMAAWWLGSPKPISARVTIVVVIGSALCLALATSLWRVPQASLRWDTRVWHLDTAPGALTVAIDLGPWMLLRFAPEDGARIRWLPVQRGGLEAEWHALRCAVHSPAPQGPS